MPRKKTLDKELEFLRSMWEVINTLERESDRAVTLIVTPTVQKGVFYFSLEARHKQPPAGEVSSRSAVGMRFPSASSTSLAGFLFWQAIRLESLIGDEELAAAQLENKGG